MKKYLLFVLIIISCSQKSPEVKAYFLTKKTDNYSDSKFYKDFDIFSRKGIGQLIGDTLNFPFFQVRDLNDSTIELTQFTTEIRIDLKIPKDDRITYQFHDIADGPRHVYTKIFADKIVSFGYDNTLKELEEIQTDSISLQDILPSEIVIMERDTINSYYFGQCLDLPGIDIDAFRVSKGDIDKYWIEPFTAKLKLGCRDKVSFFDEAGTQKEYFERIIEEKQNPGIVGQKEFQFWRPYYGVEY
jgi:hypothetical protein